ncbi:MAG TPA: hypothetical protein IAB59_07565 [Candidatus Onthousia faecipullorum]|uniref:Uncharacterized protein n=1 Tax=Candidatus Onthousia faecipullorum TaxID=2840887 RepID=A0A9D1GBT7_9FIRM|nr:hypothetical protein [Candidatus Onthousia faecipullorum]
MLELIKERKVLKDNSTFFKLLKVALERDLTEKEKNKFLESSYRNIGYLEEEFKCANESHAGNYNDGIITRNGIVLVSQLRDGLNITKDNFIKENIEQFSAHYQCVKEYEEAFVTYRDNRFTESYFRTIEAYNEAIDYSDGYTMKKTLTKC